MESLTNKERAERTYRALQKRKVNKKRKLEVEANGVYLNSIVRCKKLRNVR